MAAMRPTSADTSFANAVKLLCVSFDSTIRANLSVDLPLDLQVLGVDEYKITHQRRFERHDPYFQNISRGWSDALRDALNALPDFSF